MLSPGRKRVTVLMKLCEKMGLEKEVIKRVPFHATRGTLSEIYSEPS